MEDNIFTVTASLFLVINAIGNIPMFVGYLSRFSHKHQQRIIVREMVIALIILLLFNFFGDWILFLLQISRHIIGIAGGVILFLIALSMVFPKHSKEAAATQEPIFVPLAMPMIAGPGTITAVMVYAGKLPGYSVLTLGIIFAWIGSLIVLLGATQLKRFLGEKGLVACERLGGMLICLIAVQMLSSGIIQLVKESF